MEDKVKPKINFIESIFKKETPSRKAETKVSSLLEQPDALNKEARLKRVAAESQERDPDILLKFPFGLDIGSSFIKVSQFAKTTTSPCQLIELQMIDMPAQSRDMTVLDRKEIIVRTLKNMLSSKDTREAHLSIPTSLAELKLLRLPPMPYNEVNEAINWELKQARADKMDDFAIDCLFLNDEEKQNIELEILVVKVAKKSVQEYCDLVRDAGLKPLTLEADPLAIISILNFVGQLKEDVVLVLDLGNDNASFNVVCQGKLHFSRSLAATGLHLTRSIAAYCGIDFNSAENLKLNYGLTGSEGEGIKVRNAVVPQIENLVSDIEHSFKYFSYQLTQSKIAKFDKVVLSGGTANLKGLVDFLKARLEVSIEIANPLKGIDINPEIKKNFNLDKLAPSLSTSVGLAIRQIDEKR